MTGSERTQDAEAKSGASFSESLAEARAENERSESPNDDGGQSTAADTDNNAATSRSGGLLDSIADTLTAPPTDSEDNARSTSPVSDRINNTKNYSFDEAGTFFGNLVGGPEITPERRQSLADGAAVIDGVIVEAAYPGPAAPEPLWVYRNKGTWSDIRSGLNSDAHDGLSAGAELASDGRDRLSVFDFLTDDPLLIG